MLFNITLEARLDICSIREYLMKVISFLRCSGALDNNLTIKGVAYVATGQIEPDGLINIIKEAIQHSYFVNNTSESLFKFFDKKERHRHKVL
jgi:hypothetical protein